jgi:lipopolysaccharide export system permease protein
MFYDSLKKDSFIFCVQNALNTTRTALSYIDNANINLDVENKTLLSLVIEWHKKITVSFACIILFFIGAPLGAIIKKGGLGMPVVVSVFFFLAYYILTEFYVNLANEGHLAPLKAIWMPLIIFLPISIFLTSKAARDSSIFDATSYYSFINKFFSKKNRV